MNCRIHHRPMTNHGTGRFTCPEPGCESAYEPNAETMALLTDRLAAFDGEWLTDTIGLIYQGMTRPANLADPDNWPCPYEFCDELGLPAHIGPADVLSWAAVQDELIDDNDRYAA